MEEKAKEVLLRLKGEDTAFSDAFDAYVNALVKELEIPEKIAVALVTTETVKKYQRKLILHDLFSKSTVDEVLKCTNTKN